MKTRRREFAHRHVLGLGLLAAGAAAAGCEGERAQSMLHPAGESAQRIASLWWVMFTVYSAVFVVTMLAVVLALRARRRDRAVLGNRFVAVAGIFIPLGILVAMLAHAIVVTAGLAPRESDMTVRIVGHQFFWEVHYPEHGIITANELHVPVGASVEVELISADVIHSLWVPELSHKMDVLPDHENTLWLHANRPGVYRGQCAEYCGTQHAKMGLYVVAIEEREFDAWVAERQATEMEPQTPRQERGRQVFVESGCGACHGIAGTSIATEAGPDLTHLASRLSLGAATVENTPENLAAFIDNPHQFKPGNLMPAMDIDPDDLDALVAYLMRRE